MNPSDKSRRQPGADAKIALVAHSRAKDPRRLLGGEGPAAGTRNARRGGRRRIGLWSTRRLLASTSGSELAAHDMRRLSMHRLILLGWLVFGWLVFGWLVFGCQGEASESQTCRDSRASAHAAVLAGDLEGGKASLEKAKQACGKASDYDLERIERLIERAGRQARLAQTAAKAFVSPISPFIRWVETIREADKELGQTECEGRNDPAFGRCTSRLEIEGQVFFVDFYREKASAFRFRTTRLERLGCLDLGSHRDLRSWERGGAEYERCDLSGHGLRGLRGLVRRDPGRSEVFLFSADYARYDREFSALLSR